MKNAALSILVFGIYVAVTGLGFLFMPNTMLGLFGIAPTSEPWIRIVGMLMLALAFYYIMTSRQANKPFFALTVPARIGVVIVLVALALLQIGPMQLVLFAIVDLLCVIWTWWALRT
jgi:hypothetical protein